MDVSLSVVAPATILVIAADVPTVSEIAVDAPTIILVIEAHTPTLPTIEEHTIRAIEEHTTTIATTGAPNIPEIAADAPSNPAVANRGRQNAGLVQTRITRRRNSCDDWVDISSWQTNEAAGPAVEKNSILYEFR
jgi:hypothetical protein